MSDLRGDETTTRRNNVKRQIGTINKGNNLSLEQLKLHARRAHAHLIKVVETLQLGRLYATSIKVGRHAVQTQHIRQNVV